jgi:AAA domain
MLPVALRAALDPKDGWARKAPEKEMTMTSEPFKFTSTPAARAAIWLRLFLCGAGGSGKTYSAMAIACALAKRLDAGPLHVIDSEHGSALRYAKSPRSGRGFDFVHTPMPEGDYHPATYEEAIGHVLGQGAHVILIDSISHEWDGANGCLEQVDRIAKLAEERGKKPDNFSAWRDVTPMHRRFLETLLSAPAHVIVTLRAKMTYESRKDDRGRMKFEKVGLGPIQRDGIEYESDIFGWMSDATLTIDKTRCDRIPPQSTFEKPGDDVAALLAEWITDAEPAAPAPAQKRSRVDELAEAPNPVEARLVLASEMEAKGVPADKQRGALARFDRLVAERAGVAA